MFNFFKKNNNEEAPENTLGAFQSFKEKISKTSDALVNSVLNIVSGKKELDEFSKSGSKRPARLYEFDEITMNSKRGHFFS